MNPDRDAITGVELTQLLHSSRHNEAAQNQIYDYVYADLRDIAAAQVRQNASQTLSATALVHEAYLRIARRTGSAWNDRSHFFRLAAQAMRQITVDHARRRLSKKRGSGKPGQTFEDQLPNQDQEQESEMVLAIQDALGTLQESDQRMVQIVEFRFFAGLTEEETAAALDISVRTVQREWARAREWLKEHLSDSTD